ncbi:DUF4351 domain-containing protein [Limnofasciculus baicalensis]|uniref:DUF4351 domain-containing protein n=1 Tax=Limnofasciculus baicalensis BBK-W-15 TaxID=2699891 RepID=A0AAE3GPC5_9CYAN|nr:DUF4351 domain-containing protein [Limnofasciculus baicalensis BBK-W-15]
MQQRREGQITLIIHQLTRRLGEINLSLIQQIQQLSIEELTMLGEALLDFSGLTDLVTWLAEPLKTEEDDAPMRSPTSGD